MATIAAVVSATAVDADAGTFTQLSGSALSGYRWPAEVILAALRWYLRYPLSARQVAELLAERGVDVSARTVLSWVQTFGPLLAKETDRYRRRLGRRWYVDELFLCRGGKKHYLYRAVDQRGQVVDVLLRERRDLASAEAFFRRAVKRWVLVSDHHQPYVKAVNPVPVDLGPVHSSAGSRTRSFGTFHWSARPSCSRHLSCSLWRFAKLSRDEAPRGSQPAFVARRCCLLAQPLSGPLQVGLRFLRDPKPTALSARLAARFPHEGGR